MGDPATIVGQLDPLEVAVASMVPRASHPKKSPRRTDPWLSCSVTFLAIGLALAFDLRSLVRVDFTGDSTSFSSSLRSTYRFRKKRNVCKPLRVLWIPFKHFQKGLVDLRLSDRDSHLGQFLEGHGRELTLLLLNLQGLESIGKAGARHGLEGEAH